MRRGAAPAILSAVLVVVAVLAGCGIGGGDDAGPDENRPLVMGASGTPESLVMAQIYAGALRTAGAQVSVDPRIGGDTAQLDAMQRGDVELFPAFTGRLLSELAPSLAQAPVSPAPSTQPAAEGAAAGDPDSDILYVDLNHSLPQGVSVGDATPVSATPQLFVATSLATTAGVNNLSGCARLPADLPVVTTGEPDPTTLQSFADAGCRMGPVQQVADVHTVLERAATGAALGLLTPLQIGGDSASGPTGLVEALPAPADSAGRGVGPQSETLVPVYRTAALTRDQVKAVNRVAGEITTADLATLAGKVRAGANPSDLAADWLNEHQI
ncbi:ABC transporter substrate-binding protein [Gordonia oryzae]|uniref:ABC transporter substrate-binding protein n=1 Tax=Gordonia oryzae TaxID=2487349 RepID=A0A3N4HFE6_9ACTN|nr:glycine betaine ABC transporter substrate-binding protein [Gordonia oryzae]RPA65374.1 ABC transporter substrate-binding protein [Gordonia oryzae]